MQRSYRVGEFAALTGVSVRTLHHYDRIGLLVPSDRTEVGHRRYAEADLPRLQQVLTLRYLGFGLARIRELLALPEFDLVASLRIQRRALRDRVAELERIEALVAELIEARLTGGRWPWELLVRTSTAVQRSLEEKEDRMDRYYSEEQMKQFAELAREVPEDERLAVERGWTALLADLRANRDLDPASPRAQELAERWDALTEAVVSGFRGRTELLEAVAENYRQERFVGDERAPQPEDFAFIARVKAARDGAG